MHQQTATATTMAFPSLPASPTLTNPDMILPYGDYDSTPSPPHNPDRPPSPLGGWKSGDMDFSIGSSLSMGMGLGGAAPMTPTTPIIYGNGTMLSDIGEVTEAESTPGRKESRTIRRTQELINKDGNSPIRSSPTMGYNALMKRSKTGTHVRTVSAESTSTVTTEGQAAEYFEDFDDGVSVDDSNFQGDDEESVVDGHEAYAMEAAQARIVQRKEGKVVAVEDTSQSSAALSRRAEMILANAKKRLDNMEGNLTRARSSLYITPSSSMSSIHSSSPLSRSTPSPPDSGRIIAGLGVPPARHRHLNNIKVSGSPGHSRVLSENSIPASPTSPRLPTSARQSFIVEDEKSTNSLTQNRNTGPLSPLRSGDNLKPKNWTDDVRSSTADPYSQRDANLYANVDHKGLTRSTSSMQMRDLNDKMKHLKDRISDLKHKTREDSMKRQSLQSLRTPSPFTAAEHWYTAHKEDAPTSVSTWNNAVGGDGSGKGSIIHVGDTDLPSKGENVPVDPLAESEQQSVYEDVAEEARGSNPEEHAGLPILSESDENYDTAAESVPEEDDDVEAGGNHFENDEYEEELVEADAEYEEEYESDTSGATSLYHDTLTTPISHEDREDAFDYEHFFLHSAMGTLSQQRGRSGSFSSEDSVETTRGLSPQPPSSKAKDANADSRTAKGHLRSQKSTDSVSTLATFATARERTSEDLGSREDIVDEEGEEDFPLEDELPPSLNDDDERPETPLTAKRSTFGTPTNLPLDNGTSSSTEAAVNYSRPSSAPSVSGNEANSQPNGKPRNGHSIHRPSIASFASSTGTTRSFPLVNKVPTPGSVREARRNLSADGFGRGMVRNGSSAGAADGRYSGGFVPNGIANGNVNGRENSPVQHLVKDDQILVEALVAGLGRCVLGLQESTRGSEEGRAWRRRLEVARRVLEGESG